MKEQRDQQEYNLSGNFSGVEQSDIQKTTPIIAATFDNSELIYEKYKISNDKSNLSIVA